MICAAAGDIEPLHLLIKHKATLDLQDEVVTLCQLDILGFTCCILGAGRAGRPL